MPGARKASVYLETSVVNMYFEERVPPLMEVTRQFWSVVLPKMNGFVSDMVILEVDATRDAGLRGRLGALISEFPALPLTEEARALAAAYLRQRRLPEPDGIHVAIASLEGMDYIVTWNLRHLVKPGTQAVVRRVNMEQGLPVPLTVTPEDFFEEE